MKNIVLALVVTLAAVGVAHAQTKAPAKSAVGSTGTTAKAKAKTIKAEVVSADAAAKTLTVKDASGASTTYTATGGAVAALSTVKAGDWVTVTAMDTTASKIVKAPTKTHAKK